MGIFPSAAHAERGQQHPTQPLECRQRIASTCCPPSFLQVLRRICRRVLLESRLDRQAHRRRPRHSSSCIRFGRLRWTSKKTIACYGPIRERLQVGGTQKNHHPGFPIHLISVIMRSTSEIRTRLAGCLVTSYELSNVQY